MTDAPLWMWIFFFCIVMALLAFDLGVLHRNDEKMPTVQKTLVQSLFYIAVAILFGAGVWWVEGAEKGSAYFTGWLIEKSLSIDNLFVISMVFTYFSIPKQYHHRVLFWGILGALVFRALLIFSGSALVEHVHGVLYVFGAFLMWTGIRMFPTQKKKHEHKSISEPRWIVFLKRFIPVTKELHGARFFVKQSDSSGVIRHAMTPLFLSLLCIEWMDLVFAIDSVPAIFAITTDTFVIYTSNVFAILGLRALYFALQYVLDRFHYLNYSLSLILVFIGSKIFIVDVMKLEKFPTSVSLSVTLLLLALGALASLIRSGR